MQLELFDTPELLKAPPLPNWQGRMPKHYAVLRNKHSYIEKWPQLIEDMQRVIELKGWVVWGDLSHKWDLGPGRMYPNLFNRIRLAVFPKVNIKKLETEINANRDLTDYKPILKQKSKPLKSLLTKTEKP
jgi:hypothetical protein